MKLGSKRKGSTSASESSLSGTAVQRHELRGPAVRINAIIFTGMCLASTVSFGAQQQYAKQTFDEATGQLYWDLNEQVRLEFVPSCRANGPWERPQESWLDAAVETIDMFWLMEQSRSSLVCSKRGIRFINKLKQDGSFSDFDRPTIYINKEWAYLVSQDTIQRHFAEKNYEPVYAALQTATPVNISIKTDLLYNSIELTQQIDTSRIDQAEKTQTAIIQRQIDEKNTKLDVSHTLFLILNALIALGILWLASAITLKHFSKVKAFAGGLKMKLAEIHRLRFRFKPIVIERNTISIEPTNTFSVADELSKLARLRDEGNISQDEFFVEKTKLLSAKAS